MDVEARFHEPAEESRKGRAASQAALGALERALAAPTPGREREWLEAVIDTLSTFIRALDDQARSDLGDQSLLAEIGRTHPRFAPRIRGLHHEHSDLRAAAGSLQTQAAFAADDTGQEIDIADFRERLAAIARRYRQHRARETDLVYEATSVDLTDGRQPLSAVHSDPAGPTSNH